MNSNLKFKSDEVLVDELKAMVAEERRLLIQILHYLREVKVRKLFASRGCDSLHEFAVKVLGYSDPAADRRIKAMRLIKEVPQVEEKLESGKLSLSVVARVQGFIRREEKKRSEENTEPISKSEKLELVKQMEGTSARECEKKLIAISPETALPREKTRPLTEDKTLIQFVADENLMKKIEKLKFLMAHQNYEGRYDKLFEKVVDMALEKLDPEQREMRRATKREEKKLSELTPTSDSNSPSKDENPRSRHIPQSIRDQVWVRDHGACQIQRHRNFTQPFL